MRKFLKRLFPSFYEEIKEKIISEKRFSKGKENPDKIFYVYGMNDTIGGIWWQINKVLMHIAYAEDKGYVPVIDMQNYHNQYTDFRTKGKVNVWEVFFKQPSGYSVDDISKSKNIIRCRRSSFPSPEYEMGQYQFYNNEDRIAYFHDVFRRTIHFNEQTQNYLNRLYDEVFKGGRRVVGVLCRGTDYVLKKPKGHPIQPNPEDVIKDVEEAMLKYNCEYVFLATEDVEIHEKFKSVFGCKLLSVNQMRVSKNEMNGDDYVSKINMRKNRDIDIFSKGIGYLSATYILSKCTCYIAGRTGGTKGVLLMTDGFEYKKIYDLGIY